MIERIIAKDGAPAQGPYSHAVKAGGFIHVSGQASLDPATGQFVTGSVAEETHRTIGNIRTILQAAGADLGDVIKCSVFLADIRDFKEMNEVYDEYFGEAKPARTTIQAVLPGKGIRVEIDCVAYKP